MVNYPFSDMQNQSNNRLRQVTGHYKTMSSKSHITTHVLDTANGVAAKGIAVTLEKTEASHTFAGPWHELGFE